MRRVVVFSLLLGVFSTSTFANPSGYGQMPSAIRSFFHRVVKILDDIRGSLPPG
jgi:hypothetical protein